VKREVLRLNVKNSFGAWDFILSGTGGLTLVRGGKTVLDGTKPPLIYRIYGGADYDFWLNNYTRDIKHTRSWAFGDFARPGLKAVEKKYKSGDFPFEFRAACIRSGGESAEISTEFLAPNAPKPNSGAPARMLLRYTLTKDAADIEIFWEKKTAARLTESVLFRMYPGFTGENPLTLYKLGIAVNPNETVENGGRNLAAVEKSLIRTEGGAFWIENVHAPLIARGGGDILRFENALRDINADGISFVLYDNVWGTNFPLWYEDNAYFRFSLSPIVSG
jgi:hypothetical protein